MPPAMNWAALSLSMPIIGVVAAVAITATMDATGLSAFSALPLCPLMLLFWYLQHVSRRRMGFVWGQLSHYGLTVFYPVTVIRSEEHTSELQSQFHLVCRL